MHPCSIIRSPMWMGGLPVVSRAATSYTVTREPPRSAGSRWKFQLLHGPHQHCGGVLALLQTALDGLQKGQPSHMVSLCPFVGEKSAARR
jgi:hypothetical protein